LTDKKLSGIFIDMGKNTENLEFPSALSNSEIDGLVAEGIKLLEQDHSSSAIPSDNPVRTNPLNPYVRARAQVLKEMKSWQQKEIADMEASGKTEQFAYQEFIKKVVELGDKFSS
jgi:hypothetical protein